MLIVSDSSDLMVCMASGLISQQANACVSVMLGSCADANMQDSTFAIARNHQQVVTETLSHLGMFSVEINNVPPCQLHLSRKASHTPLLQ